MLPVRLTAPFRSRRAKEWEVPVQTEHPVSGRRDRRKILPSLLQDFPDSEFPVVGQKSKEKAEIRSLLPCYYRLDYQT